MTTKILIPLSAVVAAILVWTHVPVAEAIAGLALAFVLPGYALVGVLFARRALGAVERLVLVPALSLAVAVLGGLLLYVSGIRLSGVSFALFAAGVTVVAAAVGEFRARRTGEAVEGAPGLREAVSRVRADWRSASWRTRTWRWVAPALVSIVLLGAAGWISLGSAHTQERASGVTQLSMLQTGTGLDRQVSLDLSTRNADPEQYRIVVRGSADFQASFAPRLGADATWSRDIALPIGGRVTADLYRGAEVTPYRSVFVDVT